MDLHILLPNLGKARGAVCLKWKAKRSGTRNRSSEMRILGVAWYYTPRGAIQIGILRVRLQCSVPWIFPKRIQPTEATSVNVRLFVLGDQARNTR